MRNPSSSKWFAGKEAKEASEGLCGVIQRDQLREETRVLSRGEKVGFEETLGKYYEKYKAVLGVKTQAAMQKKDQGGTLLSLC